LNTLEQIIQGCQNGRETSLKALFDLFSKKMYKICLRYTRNKEEAEDILQEGFIKVFQNIKHFRKESAIETWITRIMINTCISQIRKERNISFNYNFDWVEDDLNLADESDADHANYHEPEKVLMAIQALPDNLRIVFNLFALDGLSHKEVSKSLNISVDNSKILVHRARKVLCNSLVNSDAK
jgi:RNA polymerase sigma factor (sigma-70 family)